MKTARRDPGNLTIPVLWLTGLRCTSRQPSRGLAERNWSCVTPPTGRSSIMGTSKLQGGSCDSFVDRDLVVQGTKRYSDRLLHGSGWEDDRHSAQDLCVKIWHRRADSVPDDVGSHFRVAQIVGEETGISSGS